MNRQFTVKMTSVLRFCLTTPTDGLISAVQMDVKTPYSIDVAHHETSSTLISVVCE